MPLLAVIIWGPWQLGYEPGVYSWAVLIAWIVLLLTRWLTKPESNINHVYGLPVAAAANLTPLQHMLVLMAAGLLFQTLLEGFERKTLTLVVVFMVVRYQ